MTILLYAVLLLVVSTIVSDVKGKELWAKSNKVVTADDIRHVGERVKRAGNTGLDQSEKDTVLSRHNIVRAGEGGGDIMFMKWNSILAEMAQAWAEGCQWDHGQPSGTYNHGYTSLGQNLYYHSSTMNVTAAVQAWFDEKTDYDYSAGSCSAVCGHYTQVVWADSVDVGCGFHVCSSMTVGSSAKTDARYFVCNYGPAGNMQGEKPFKKAPSCTKCSSGEFHCYEGLCINNTDCNSAGVSCPCQADCQNCGSQTSDCSCTCGTGWAGVDCADECVDTHSNCNNGWYTAQCVDYDYVRKGCPAMCSLCVAGTAATCEPETTAAATAAAANTASTTTSTAAATADAANTASTTASTAAGGSNTTTTINANTTQGGSGGPGLGSGLTMYILLLYCMLLLIVLA